MTADEAIRQARYAGRQAALDGEPFSSNPFDRRKESVTFPLFIAWGQGFGVGEIEADDAAGDLFRGTAK